MTLRLPHRVVIRRRSTTILIEMILLLGVWSTNSVLPDRTEDALTTQWNTTCNQALSAVARARITVYHIHLQSQVKINHRGPDLTRSGYQARSSRMIGSLSSRNVGLPHAHTLLDKATQSGTSRPDRVQIPTNTPPELRASDQKSDAWTMWD